MIYTAYAPIYAAIDQGAFARRLMQTILRHEPLPQYALDLACGIGAATLVLARAGVSVTGIDRSPEMLSIARAETYAAGVAASFIEADLRRLDYLDLPGESFDLAISLYDSLNYLIGNDDLERVFAHTARLLRPGGQFIFDLNTEHEFIAWDETDQLVYDDGDLLVYNRLSYEPERRLARGKIVWFRREGALWQRGEENHVERAWSEAEIAAALASAGLVLRDRRTPDWKVASADAPRVVYCCTRV